MATTKRPAQPKKAPAVPKKTTAAAAKSAKAEHLDPEESIESALNKTESFLFQNGKMLLSILAVIVLVVAGWMSYKYLYLGHRGEKAGEMMYVAEQLFGQGQYELALNGDGTNAGFIDVIAKYKATAQGNIAKHYAGLCYLQTGDNDKALEYLSQYKAVKGAPGAIINAQNLGLQGDLLVEKGDLEGAVTKYRKAIDAADNSFSTPTYLKKIALVYSELGRPADAIAAYQRIIDQYPNSTERQNAEKYIGLEEQK